MEVQIAGSLDTVTYFVRMPDCIEEIVINFHASHTTIYLNIQS